MPRRAALLILTSETSDEALRKLPKPDVDLTALSAALSEASVGDFEVTRLVDEDVQSLREAIVRLYRSVGPQDVALLFYAGQALQDQFGAIYLTARDTKVDVLEASGLEATFLRDQLDKSRCNQKFVVLDCPTTATFDGGRQLLGSTSGILESIEGNRRGRFLICATDLIGAALEAHQLFGEPSKSALGPLLGQGLRSGEADLNSDGQVTAEELHEYLYKQSFSREPTKPLPRRSSSPELDQIVLARNPVWQPVELPAEVRDALLSPLIWMRQGAVAELERLLTSENKSLSLAARQALAELTADQTPAVARSATAILQSHPSAGPTAIGAPEPRDHAAAEVPRRERPSIPLWGWIAGGLVALFAIGLVAGSVFRREQSAPPPQPTASPAPPEPSAVPALATEIPSPEPTPVAEVPLPSSVGMVSIPADTYPIGSNLAVELGAYWIDQFEVSNSAYATYLEQTGQPLPRYWVDSNIPTELGNHPVRTVTWSMADNYCRWLGKRLPSEAEWEVAARGPGALLYPWGDAEAAVDLTSGGTYPVGAISANRSFFGVYDMAGNVWEWVDLPYSPIREEQRILRGGANNFLNDMTYRLVGDPEASATISDAGFRCGAEEVQVQVDPALILTDEFADILPGWFQAAEPVRNYFYGYHPTDFYHVQVSAPNDCLVVRHQLTLSDFIAEADVFQAKTETETGDYRHGLVIREAAADFYAFTISPRTKVWQILKNSPAGIAILSEGVENSIRGATRQEEDRLTVVANGAELAFSINGRLVSRVYDAAYRDGNVGFIVQTRDETYAHIHFDRIFLWQLPENTVPISEVPAGSPASPRVSAPTCAGSVSGDNLLESFSTYTVKEGDTLSLLANTFGLTISEIMGANGRRITDSNEIKVGQVLIIPRHE